MTIFQTPVIINGSWKSFVNIIIINIYVCLLFSTRTLLYVTYFWSIHPLEVVTATAIAAAASSSTLFRSFSPLEKLLLVYCRITGLFLTIQQQHCYYYVWFFTLNRNIITRLLNRFRVIPVSSVYYRPHYEISLVYLLPYSLYVDWTPHVFCIYVNPR